MLFQILFRDTRGTRCLQEFLILWVGFFLCFKKEKIFAAQDDRNFVDFEDFCSIS